MKTILAFFIVVLTSHVAHAELPLVLGVNLEPELTPWIFPCTAYSSFVQCGNQTFADPVCAKTLNFKNSDKKTLDISCKLSDGRNVLIAQAYGKITRDPFQDWLGFFEIKLNPAVSVKSINGKSVIVYQ